MAAIKPFICVRPAEDMASTIAALPYDVYNRAEAKEVVMKNPKSFLAIDRAESQFPDDVDTYDDRVYAKAAEMIKDWKADGSFVTDDKRCYYIYELTMNGRTQTGIVATASIDDYANNIIKKHENTRADKEADRIRHVDTCSAQTGPIFLAYRQNDVITEVVNRTKQGTALYNFVSDDGIRHRVFKIDADADIAAVENAFAGINEIYIADGHHRAASAVKVGFKRRDENPGYDGTEEFNFFLSVLFPDEELMIMDYNRVIKDLKGMDAAAFLAKVSEIYEVSLLGDAEELKESRAAKAAEDLGASQDAGDDIRKPAKKGEFSMLLDGKWYRVSVKDKDRTDDPVAGLDVSLLQDLLLGPVLGIADPKTDPTIDFVGGIRGLDELERRCKTDCVAAFAMYPTSIHELFAVADAGLLMPPKSTWFEPKLRSGLFIHEI